MEIESDNPALDAPLRAMADMVIRHGGLIAPGTRIVSTRGDIRLERAPGCGACEHLLAIPRALLVPINHLAWDDDRTLLRLASPASHLSAERQAMLDLFLAIYNASGKLAAIDQHPAVAFASDPELLALVQMLKPGVTAMQGTAADLLLSCRLVVHGESAGDLANVPVLMPLMDFINHHPEGDCFRYQGNDLVIGEYRAAGSSECLASYGGQRDVLDLLCGHGFVDPATPYFGSAPARLPLGRLGTLVIEGRAVHSNLAIHPPRTTFGPDEVRLSHVVLDRRKPGAWRQLLRMPLLALGHRRGCPEQEVEHALRALPGLLLEANRTVLDSVAAALEHHPNPAATVRDLQSAIAIHAANLRDSIGPGI